MYTETNGILAGNLPIEILGQVENGKVRRAALDFDGTISFIQQNVILSDVATRNNIHDMNVNKREHLIVQVLTSLSLTSARRINSYRIC